jgi:ribonuclease HI
MNMLSWNCRGLGTPRSVRDLHQMVKEMHPRFVFLMETLSSKFRMEWLRVKLGFAACFVVEPVGRSGGLALLWKEEREIEIYNFSRRHINAIVKDGFGNGCWKFTGFYGHPVSARRVESWEILKHLKSHLPVPWLCVRDFNEILDPLEKRGAAVRGESQMDGFRDALGECQLSDLGFQGPKFTWSNRRDDDMFTIERLDRAVANSEWCSMFKEVSVYNLAARTSDHSSVQVRFATKISDLVPFHRGFKFEDCWTTDAECMDVIDTAWHDGGLRNDRLREVQSRLFSCQKALHQWSVKKFGNVVQQLKRKNKLLEELQQRASPALLPDIKSLQGEIEELLKVEDIKWKQRAKQSWYKSGDQNTKYFHSWANQRRQTNRILQICDEQGTVWKKRADISRVFVDYFARLYTSQGPNRVQECLANVEARVDDDLNSQLLRPFVEEEVYVALSQMHPLKSPGSDGYNAGFFQKSWHITGKEVSKAALHFLNGGDFVGAINSTNIVLIHKVNSPSRVTEYRPISLCNVFYKLIAKVLANRFKQVLPLVISPEQSAFIPGRLITDNILVAFESLHTMDTRIKGKEGYIEIKLDMSKAYDRVEWDFLEAVLVKMGFANRWIRLLMTCVRSVSYSILINGHPHGKIVSSRGLRQGDPLSPYFFILCAEAMSSLLHFNARVGSISGISIARGGPTITHLFFADDSVLFCRANIKEWGKNQDVLECYEAAPGQKINREKTSLFFSWNTKPAIRTILLGAVGVASTQRYETYLGLPALIGRSKMSVFQGIKGRIWARLHGWKEKFLSHAGKEILLKAVIQAIPTYTMSVFQLPKTICKEINSLMSKFWWGFKENTSKIAWMSWKRLGKTRESGGLGYRELEAFNLALLAKQGWRLLSQPDTLVARVYRAKYFVGGDFLASSLGRGPSFAWRSIWNARSLLQEGLQWKVGNGENIRIWGDRWLPNTQTHTIQSLVCVLDGEAKVYALFNHAVNWWNVPLVESIFPKDVAALICGMVVSPRSQVDKVIWAGTKNGCFSVKSAYHLEVERRARACGSCSSGPASHPMWKTIWKLGVPKSTQLFLWRGCNDILPSREKLYHRKVVPDPLCQLCGVEVETSGHLLWQCKVVSAIWALAPRKIQKCVIPDGDFLSILQYISSRVDLTDLELVAVIAHKAWLQCNRIVFGGSVMSPRCLMECAKAELQEFHMATASSSHPLCHPLLLQSSWQRPPVGWIKLNWDAATDHQNGLMGVGLVARDSRGQVQVSLCHFMPYLTDPTVAEAFAARRGVELCSAMGFTAVIFEGDSQMIVKALLVDETQPSSFDSIVADTQLLLSSFPQWQVRFVRRTDNDVAHRLARMAVKHKVSHVWVESIPSSISDAICKDLESSS